MQRKATLPNRSHDDAIMQALLGYLAMGGYAAFVWPAYAIATLVLAGLVWQSRHAYRRRQRELDRLQQGRARRGSAA
jgi:heme exporter protein D